jgi:hypothetical protein
MPEEDFHLSDKAHSRAHDRGRPALSGGRDRILNRRE